MEMDNGLVTLDDLEKHMAQEMASLDLAAEMSDEDRMLFARLPVTLNDFKDATRGMFLIDKDTPNIWAKFNSNADVIVMSYLDVNGALAKRSWSTNDTNRIWGRLYAMLSDRATYEIRKA